MRGKDVYLRGLGITYPNGFTAVQPTDLHIKAGEFFSILGPSGCGKTTILRAVSGFVTPTEGNITIGGQDQTGIGPNNRPTALIFQNLALFPLMSVWENVAFGLEARGLRKSERRQKAMDLLELVALTEHADKKPDALSGGQKQRVAIARALAVEPAVLLLDEPLSALDLKLRQHMRAELRNIQKKTGVTFIYITHDQGEALTMSDRIAVMNNGVIEQVGTGDDIYSNPTSAFVASFVGEANQFNGHISAIDGEYAVIETDLGALRGRIAHSMNVNDAATVFVRPECMELQTGHDNSLTATLISRNLEGAYVVYDFDIAGFGHVMVHHTNNGASIPNDGEQQLGFSAQNAIVLPRGPIAHTGRDMAAK